MKDTCPSVWKDIYFSKVLDVDFGTAWGIIRLMTIARILVTVISIAMLMFYVWCETAPGSGSRIKLRDTLICGIVWWTN